MSKVLGLKKKIRSVNNIGRITNTLYKVSLSYVSFWEQAIINVKDYYKNFVSAILLSGHAILPFLPELYKDKVSTDTIIVWGPRQGLCGPLLARLKDILKENAELLARADRIILINDKLYDFVIGLLSRFMSDLEAKQKVKVFKMGAYTNLKGVSKFGQELFSALQNIGEQSFTAIYPFYNGNLDYTINVESINLLDQIELSIKEIKNEIQTRHLTKASIQDNIVDKTKEELGVIAFNNDIVSLDVPAEQMAKLLMDYYLFTSILVKSIHLLTSEHIGRMVAMKNATDNVTKMLKELNLSYNRQRQASITNELLDIVNAKRALD